MKNKRTRNIIIALVILVIAVWLINKYIKHKNSIPTQVTGSGSGSSSGGSTSGSSSTSGSTSSTCTNTTVLKQGTKCDRVQWSQYEINRVRTQLGISKLTEDGIFGSATQSAFQKLLGKSTGSYAEVFNKVKSLLGTSTTVDVNAWWPAPPGYN